MSSLTLPRNRRAAPRRGVAAVEFAIVAPLFFMLIFGMIEYGRMIMVQQIITNAAREGARIGVLDGTTSSQVTTTVNTYLTNATIKGATVTVTPSVLDSSSYGTPITVRVSIPYSAVSWTPSPWFLGSTTLQTTATMRRESPQ